ncbi:MAG: rhodanese-like domain-containing protein [Planctomycetes bacterium]|nr:rhodanese-like domain-containing protein [Planctomycetota bacterium]
MSTDSVEFPLEIDCPSVKAKIDAGESFLLLDCRESGEHALVHIAGDRLLPMSEMMTRAGGLEPHRDEPIVVYCHLGLRSREVAAWLRQRGFPRVQSMTGGIEQWAVEIDPTLRRY